MNDQWHASSLYTVKKLDTKGAKVAGPSKLSRRLLSVALPGLLGACSALAPSESSLPTGAMEIAAPEVYQVWLAKTEACSGLSGDFSTLKFYVVPGVETFPTSDGSKVGEWTSNGATNRIIIAGNYQNHEMVVRHELLHSLLSRTGHPAEYFVTRCKLTWESWNGADGSVAMGNGD